MTNTQLKAFLPIILGLLTLTIFSTTPYILNLVEPNKSLGQMIGENTKDLLDTMSGKTIVDRTISKRVIWANVLAITSFILLGLSILTAVNSLKNKSTRWIGIIGVLLAFLGLSFFFTYLAISMIGLIVIVCISVLFTIILKLS